MREDLTSSSDGESNTQIEPWLNHSKFSERDPSSIDYIKSLEGVNDGDKDHNEVKQEDLDDDDEFNESSDGFEADQALPPPMDETAAALTPLLEESKSIQDDGKPQKEEVLLM